MNTPGASNESAKSTRAVGFIQPAAESAVRAVAALRDRRLGDAEKHIAAIEESSAVDRAWKRFLQGRLACERSDFESAETPLRQAAASALERGLSRQPGEAETDVVADVDAVRLAAAALEALGLALRRQDRPAESYRAHRIAFRLREEHGSIEEQWESALGLGRASALARDMARAETWYRTAALLADQTREARSEKRAITWAHFSALLIDAGRHNEAVAAARKSAEFRREHDAGSLDAPKAEMTLGFALLKAAEAAQGESAEASATLVREAMRTLQAACESLRAFGELAQDDVQACEEGLAFADKLQISMES